MIRRVSSSPDLGNHRTYSNPPPNNNLSRTTSTPRTRTPSPQQQLQNIYTMQHQRSLDILLHTIGALASGSSIKISKLWVSTWWDNAQRLGYPTIYLITIWFATCSDVHYKKYRNKVVGAFRWLIPLLPSHRSPKFLQTRLNVDPSPHPIAGGLIDSLRIFIGSGLVVWSTMCVFSPLPLWSTIIAQTIAFFGHLSPHLCTSKLLTSPQYQNILSSFYGWASQLTSICCLSFMSLRLPPVEKQPVDECRATVTFLYLVIGAVLPILLTITVFTPPVVVLGCRENTIDKSIVSFSTVFVRPNKVLLRESGLTEEDVLSFGERLMYLGALLAVCWQLSTC